MPFMTSATMEQHKDTHPSSGCSRNTLATSYPIAVAHIHILTHHLHTYMERLLPLYVIQKWNYILSLLYILLFLPNNPCGNSPHHTPQVN